MAKQTGQAAGVHEDGPLTGRDVAVGYEFDQAREAFAHLESGAHLGKVVVRC